MVAAMLYPEPDKPGRGKRGKSNRNGWFSQQRLNDARAFCVTRAS